MAKDLQQAGPGKGFLDYAPAPESREILRLRPSYGLFIDGGWVDGHGTPFTTIAPATEERLAEIASADAHDVELAVAAARRAYDRVWSRMSGADRGKYLFRIARLVQERARELAVAESLDNGKPIKESPRRRRAARRRMVLLLRRLGGQARLRRSRRKAPAARRRRAGHPMELPAAHARLEDRAGARRREHRRPEAR